MSVDAALVAFEKLKRQISRGKTATVAARADQNLAKAVAEAWFRTYRPAIVAIMGEGPVETIDAGLQRVLKLTLSQSKRADFLAEMNSIIRHLKQGLVVEAKVAEWSREKEDEGIGDARVVQRLEKISPALADAYRQVLLDLSDTARMSYRGPANELREILREVLDALAPDAEVKAETWFRKAKNSPPKDQPPTQSEKARYIAIQRGLGSSARETVEEAATAVEERLGNVVRALYKRSNAATHIQREIKEVLQILRYADAILLELLPD